MAPPAASIGNAIYDAAGVRMRSTPMTPENILKEMSQKNHIQISKNLEK
jgi:CO/xanthine dehydrogenase Mo-binding subunit